MRAPAALAARRRLRLRRRAARGRAARRRAARGAVEAAVCAALDHPRSTVIPSQAIVEHAGSTLDAVAAAVRQLTQAARSTPPLQGLCGALRHRPGRGGQRRPRADHPLHPRPPGLHAVSAALRWAALGRVRAGLLRSARGTLAGPSLAAQQHWRPRTTVPPRRPTRYELLKNSARAVVERHLGLAPGARSSLADAARHHRRARVPPIHARICGGDADVTIRCGRVDGFVCAWSQQAGAVRKRGAGM